MIWVMKCRASFQLRGPPFRCMNCLSVMPSMSSMTMYSTCSERLTSCTAMILGWESMATAWDSSWNRRRNSASLARSSLRIFTATSRLSR